MNVAESTNQFIKEHGNGSTRDALIVALAKLDARQAEIKILKDELRECQAELLQEEINSGEIASCFTTNKTDRE